MRKDKREPWAHAAGISYGRGIASSRILHPLKLNLRAGPKVPGPKVPQSIHALMVMSTYMPKTYTAMHYTKFIRPGAQRIDAEPGFDTVQVGAFLHDKDGALTVVALNPTGQEQLLTLAFRNLKSLAALKVYRTSASESLKDVGEVAVKDGQVAFPMTPQSIVTFSGKIAP